jgi:hypothetical protein
LAHHFNKFLLFFRTEIEWYPGKCLTQKVVPKKSKKGSNNTNPNPITKVEDCKSLFSFFNPPQVPNDDEQIDEDTVSLISLFVCGFDLVLKVVLTHDLCLLLI